MDDSEKRLGERLRRMPGVRTVPRRITPDGEGWFDLTYIREGEPGGIPLLIIPGGPGMASVLPYRGVRRRAVRGGFEVVMVEHRGVGLSRTDQSGKDLPFAALTVESVVADVVAVLDDCGWDQAVVYGSSYGGYLAQMLGAWHPERVRAMVLDSTASSAAEDEVTRDHLRRLFWHGDDPRTAAPTAKLRSLVDEGMVPTEETGLVVPVAYEFGGVPLVDRLLDTVRGGSLRPWKWLASLGAAEVGRRHPYYVEFDLAGAIYYRELRRVRPDGEPLDPHVLFEREAAQFPAFVDEPLNLPDALPEFSWPTAVLSGARDMRSVPPSAKRTADGLPDGVLVPFEHSAHSFLDFHPRVAVTATWAVANGAHGRLPGLASRLERMRRPPQSRAFGPLLSAWAATEQALNTATRVLPRAVRASPHGR